MPMLEPELETLYNQDSATPSQTGDTPTPSNSLSVSVDSLPKLVVCFDINSLSHRKLKAIASDLKVPGYSRMTKAELCKALLAL